jgi:hypothetical protein
LGIADQTSPSAPQFHDLYLAAPDAGWAAIYVLVQGRRVVNLERLPDRALPAAALDHPAPPILAG